MASGFIALRRFFVVLLGLTLLSVGGERVEPQGATEGATFSAAKSKAGVVLATPEHGAKVQPAFCSGKGKSMGLPFMTYWASPTRDFGLSGAALRRIFFSAPERPTLVGTVELRI